MKINKKQKAVRLRRKGLLYADIADRLGVAKSTVYFWTSKLELTDEQRLLVANTLTEAKRRQVLCLMALKKARWLRNEDAVSSRARSIVASAGLSINHKRLLCATLFWCEGEKDVSSGVRFINSDPLMIKKFLTLLRESFPLDESKFRTLVHLHDYHDAPVQLHYWSVLTEIPQNQFYKSYRKPHTGRQIRPGYQGCISVRYVDAGLGKLLKAIFVEYSKST